MYTYVDVWCMLMYGRNQTKHCKVIIFPLKIKKKKKKSSVFNQKAFSSFSSPGVFEEHPRGCSKSSLQYSLLYMD